MCLLLLITVYLLWCPALSNAEVFHGWDLARLRLLDKLALVAVQEAGRVILAVIICRAVRAITK